MLCFLVPFEIIPSTLNLHETLPFTFYWKSSEILELVGDFQKNVSTIIQVGQPDEIDSSVNLNQGYFEGTFTVHEFSKSNETNQLGDLVKEIALVRKSDGKVLHTWQFHAISKQVQNNDRIIKNTMGQCLVMI
jgi:hypothetical protein